MKNLFLFSIFVFVSLTTLNAQGQFRAGINGGLPIGDAGDYASFALAVDLGYLFEISDDFDAGIETGFTNYFGKDGFGDFKFMPITGVGKVNLSEDISAEAGLGYALSLESGGGGDFYWKIGFAYALDENSDLGLSFRSITGNGGSIDGIFLGYRKGF